MKHSYIIEISGNDIFESSTKVMADNFADTCLSAESFLTAFNKITIEQIRISGIVEVN